MHFNPPIAVLRGGVAPARQRIGIAVALGDQLLERHPAGNQVATHRLGAKLGERLRLLRRAVAVGGNFHHHVRMRAEERGQRIERWPARRRQPRAARGELDTGQHPAASRGETTAALSARWHTRWAAKGVHGGARRCARAAIQSVEYAIAILVAGAAQLIDAGTRRRVGAAIHSVGDTVAVGIFRAALLIHGCSGRRIGTGIEPVGHIVAVAIERTPGLVHLGAGRGRGAAVQAVKDVVAVGVGGAAIAVGQRAGGRVGAAVVDVVHAVLVAVGERLAAQHDTQAQAGADVGDAGGRAADR